MAPEIYRTCAGGTCGGSQGLKIIPTQFASESQFQDPSFPFGCWVGRSRRRCAVWQWPKCDFHQNKQSSSVGCCTWSHASNASSAWVNPHARKHRVMFGSISDVIAGRTSLLSRRVKPFHVFLCPFSPACDDPIIVVHVHWRWIYCVTCVAMVRGDGSDKLIRHASHCF